MQVAQYTFQSPSTSAVQVGKLDPSSVKQEESTKQSTQKQESLPQEVRPEQPKFTQAPTSLLDTYA